MIDIILQGILKIEEQNENGEEFWYSGRVSCSFFISGGHHVTLYITRCQVMTSNNSTRRKIRTIQA